MPSLPAVGILMNRRQVALNLDMARLLKRDHGSRIYLYVGSQAERQGFEARFRNVAERPFDEIIVADRLVAGLAAGNVDEATTIVRARHYEKLTGVTINRMTFGHRTASIGFAAGAVNFPRPRYFETTTYANLLHAMCDDLAFWENEITGKGLALIVDGGNQAWLMARAKGIAYRRLVPARYRNFQFWTPDEYHNHPRLREAYERARAPFEQQLDDYYQTAKTKYAMFWESTRLTHALWESAEAAAWHVYKRLRRLPSQSAEGLLWTALEPIRRRQAFRQVMRLSHTRLQDLKDRPFAYFPLHKEPEVAFLQRSPEHFDQLSTILMIARDLPAGILLAVKENPYSIGRRSEAFYRQLRDVKNVVFLSLDEDPIACVKAAAVTVTITGTAGLEAAILGRPVVTFGRHAHYLLVPHVRLVRDSADIADALAWALDRRFDSRQAEVDGMRLLKALCESSIDMGSYRVRRDASFGASPELAAVAYEALIASLRSGDDATGPPRRQQAAMA